MQVLDMKAIREKAEGYQDEMVAFLRDMIRIPSESGQEGPVIARIREEIEKVGGFDEVRIDGLGNLIARIGNGPRVIAIDAHVDTVGVGTPEEWAHDPYEGKVADGMVWGRGAGDQEGAIPSMVYAGRIIRDLGLESDEWTLLLTCTVMEEDCDGLCWQYLHKEEGITPECVVVTDSTDCRVRRGHRGRMEMGLTVKGVSCHGSMPHKGDNAVYKMARVIREVEQLNERLKDDPFIGKGTIAVTYIDCETPSLCAVPGGAYIHLDRRLTFGETKESAVAEIEELLRKVGVEGKVEILRYAVPAYTGLVYETEKYFPTWCAEESALQVRAAVDTYESLFGERQVPAPWTFSTNGVSIAGMYGIPCVGFGPAEEAVAHTVNDRVPIDHLIKCAAFYAAFPTVFCTSNPGSRAAAAGSNV